MRPVVFMAALCVTLISPFEPPNMLPALDRQLRRFSDASHAFILRTLTPAKAQTEQIDAKAAANLDEDIDWRIADQHKTANGWRAFLAAHPSGKHASLAKAALDQLEPKPEPLPSPPPPQLAAVAVPSMASFSPVVEVENEAPREPDFFAALERPPMSETKVETVVRWREQRTRYVTRWRYERPRQHYRRQPPPFFLSWFGPRDPYQRR